MFAGWIALALLAMDGASASPPTPRANQRATVAAPPASGTTFSRLPLRLESRGPTGDAPAGDPRFDSQVRPAGYEAPSLLDEPSAARPLPRAGERSWTRSSAPTDAESHTPRRTTGLSPLITTGGSLVAVLAMFLCLAGLARRAAGKQAAAVPGEVMEVLGRAPLFGRQQLHVVRFGNKLVLICATPSGIESVAEVTDPLEVDRLTGLCQQAQPGSISQSFRQVLSQLGREPAVGFVDEPPASRPSRDDTSFRI